MHSRVFASMRDTWRNILEATYWQWGSNWLETWHQVIHGQTMTRDYLWRLVSKQACTSFNTVKMLLYASTAFRLAKFILSLVHVPLVPGSMACRYLLASHLGNSERYLLNPLTHDQIRVPDAVNVDGFLPDYIGPDTIEGGDIVVMSENTNMMAFWRPEADDWVYVDGVGDWNGGNAYYMGQYFSRDNHMGMTNVIDIATKELACQVAPPDGTNPLLKGRTIIVE